MAKRGINFVFYRYSATLEVRFYVSGLCKQEKNVWNHWLLEQKQLDSTTTSQCYSAGLAFFGTTFPSDLSAVMRAVHAWNTFWFKSVLIPKTDLTPYYQLLRSMSCVLTQHGADAHAWTHKSAAWAARHLFALTSQITCQSNVDVAISAWHSDSRCLNY